MKKVAIILAIILLIPSLASAKQDVYRTYNVDLDADGVAELVEVVQQVGVLEDGSQFASEGVVTITSDGAFRGSFSMPEHLTELKFISLNSDGLKQIAAWSQSGMHFTNFAIYGLEAEEERIYKIFEAGSACGVVTDFESMPPQIKVGQARLDEPGWSYADEPDWEIWRWDSKEFSKQ